MSLIALGTWLRADFTLSCRHFDAQSSEGILTTDPALIAYICQRLVDGGGLPPSDFRADTRIEHPDPSDIPAMFTVGQEFVVAWAAGWFPDTPLHVLAVWLMSLCASLTVFGVWGAARCLAGPRWALGAAALWAALPTSYRTIGFVFIREDFALPIYAWHLWMVAAAAACPTRLRYAMVGLSAAAAAATWHAIGSFLLIEVVCLTVWFVRSGENPMRARDSGWALVALAVPGALVPVLWAKGFLLSPAVICVAAWFVAGRFASRRPQEVATFGLVAAALFGLGTVVRSGREDYAHVFRFLWDKVRLGGVLPVDPDGLAFDTRLLWQGPFDTAPISLFTESLGAVTVLMVGGAVLGVGAWRRGLGHGSVGVLTLFTIASYVVAWLIVRTQVVAGICAVLLAVHGMSRVPRRGLGALLLIVAFALHGSHSLYLLQNATPWWARPDPRQVAERADMVRWVAESVPVDAAITADYLTASGLLYHTGRPVLLQPKYETARSRRRIEELFDVFYRGTPQDLRRWMAERDSRWIVVDRSWMWGGRYLAGFSRRATSMKGRNAASRFLFDDYRNVPGFELMYETPARFPARNFRIYRAR